MRLAGSVVVVAGYGWSGRGAALVRPATSTDREIVRKALDAVGIGLDGLTLEQERYLASWHLGT